jgi:hypothetical protein
MKPFSISFYRFLICCSLLASTFVDRSRSLPVVYPADQSLEAEPKKTNTSPRESGHERLNLFGNGYFRALHGYFFLDDRNRLHVYRALPKVRNPQTNDLELQPEDNELRPLWKGEPFYHETYTLHEGEWIPMMWGHGTPEKREFSGVPEQYLKFDSCDSNDALDLQRVDLKKASWPQSKVKDVYEFGNYAALVYSLNPTSETGPPTGYRLDQRPVWLELLKKAGKTWESPDSTQSVSVGNYCGKVVMTAMRDGYKRPVLILFFQEGDDNVAHSYVAD